MIDDFEAAIITLTRAAENLKMCENQCLRDLGYRRFNFKSHRYFMFYRVEDGTVYVDNVFMSYRTMGIK